VVEDPEADAGVGEISPDGLFDRSKSGVCERIRPGEHGQHVDTGRQSPDGGNFRRWQTWQCPSGVRGHGRLEVERGRRDLRDRVSARTRVRQGTAAAWGWRRHDGVGIKEIQAAVAHSMLAAVSVYIEKERYEQMDVGISR
jgi:hypothetical protein